LFMGDRLIIASAVYGKRSLAYLGPKPLRRRERHFFAGTW